MTYHRHLVIVDDNRDGRGVISGALFYRYPPSVIGEFHSLEAAASLLTSLPADGGGAIVITGRTGEAEGAALVRAIRAKHVVVPIIALGDPADSEAALAAGATRFLDYEAWLMLGKTIEEVRAAVRERGQPEQSPTQS